MSSPTTTSPIPPWMGGDSIGLAAWQRSQHVGIVASPANFSVIGGLTSVHDRHTSFLDSLSVHDSQGERTAGDDPRVFRSAVSRAVVVKPRDVMRSAAAPRASALSDQEFTVTERPSADPVDPVHATEGLHIPPSVPDAGPRGVVAGGVGGVVDPVIHRKAGAGPDVVLAGGSAEVLPTAAMGDFSERASESYGEPMRSDALSANAAHGQVRRSPHGGRTELALATMPGVTSPREEWIEASAPGHVERKPGKPPLFSIMRFASIGQVSPLRPVSLAVRTAMTGTTASTSAGDVAGVVPGVASAPRLGDMQRRADMTLRNPSHALPVASLRASSYEAPGEAVRVPRVILHAPPMPLRRASPSAAPAPAPDRTRTPSPVAELAGTDRPQHDDVPPLPIASIVGAGETSSLGGARMDRAADQSGQTSGAVSPESSQAIVSSMLDAPREAGPSVSPASAAAGPSPSVLSTSIARHIETAPVVLPTEQPRPDVEMPLPIRGATRSAEPTASAQVTLTADRAIAVSPIHTSTDSAVVARAERVPTHVRPQVVPADRTLPPARPSEISDVSRAPVSRAMPLARTAVSSGPSGIVAAGESLATRAADASGTPAVARSATTQWRTLGEGAVASTTSSDAAFPAQGMPHKTDLPLADIQPRPGLQQVHSRPEMPLNRSSALASSTARATRIIVGIDRSGSHQGSGGTGDTGHTSASDSVPSSAETEPRHSPAVFHDETIARARSLVFSNPAQLSSAVMARRAEWPHPHGDDALASTDANAGGAAASDALTLVQRSARSPDTDPPALGWDAPHRPASLSSETSGVVHADAGVGNVRRSMPLLAASLQRRMAVNGASPDFTARAALPAIARMIDMPLVRLGASIPAGGASSPQVDRVAEPQAAAPSGAVDAWSPEAAAPPSGSTTVHQERQEQRGGHTEVDVDDIVERAWGALMSRLATEHERRGFARWA